MSIKDYLDKMVISATSPDGNIRARVSDYTKVDISFRPRIWEKYDEERLSCQLSRLGVITWVAYHRGRSEAYQRSQGLSSEELAEAEKPIDDPHRQRYEEALNAIEGEGISTGREVKVYTRGMMQWKVDIAPGAIQRLGENRLVSEIHSAIISLLNDREMKIIVVKSEYFDLGIPKKWRDLMAHAQTINRCRQA